MIGALNPRPLSKRSVFLGERLDALVGEDLDAKFWSDLGKSLRRPQQGLCHVEGFGVAVDGDRLA
jgi:hypothetical protein